jgi:DNA-binding FadR family transcriptional regulator
MLGVGRATLRQTARLLEQERLLRVKRGVGGGYYGRRPDVDAVADAAATYLRARDASRLDLFGAAAVLDVELARLAALSANPVARADLARVEAQLRDEVDMDRGRLAELELEMRDCMFRLAGNVFIELMLRIHIRFNFLGARLDLLINEARISEHRLGRVKLAGAILERDAEYAMLLTRRATQVVRRWVTEALSDDGGGPPEAAKLGAGADADEATAVRGDRDLEQLV